jgi:hypothetical protein
MSNGFELLMEKEAMWAEMLLQVLKDHGIPCTSLPVYGAGFVIKTGIQERLRIYVPAQHMLQAEALAEELFAADAQ